MNLSATIHRRDDELGSRMDRDVTTHHRAPACKILRTDINYRNRVAGTRARSIVDDRELADAQLRGHAISAPTQSTRAELSCGQVVVLTVAQDGNPIS